MADVTTYDGPGKGRKQCPVCKIHLGVRAAVCKCGHAFSGRTTPPYQYKKPINRRTPAEVPADADKAVADFLARHAITNAEPLFSDRVRTSIFCIPDALKEGMPDAVADEESGTIILEGDGWHWRGHDRKFSSLAEAAADSFEVHGELPRDLSVTLAEKFLADWKAGLIALPKFRKIGEGDGKVMMAWRANTQNYRLAGYSPSMMPVYTPAGECPVKIASPALDDVYAWAYTVREAFAVRNAFLRREGLEYYARLQFYKEPETFRQVAEHLRAMCVGEIEE